jgi:hypothetical protein
LCLRALPLGKVMIAFTISCRVRSLVMVVFITFVTKTGMFS